MNITDIRIRKILPEGRLRAVVSITLDNEIAVHDIKVIEGPERLFVAMPSRKEESGTYRDIIHPISAEARRTLEDAILSAYKTELANIEASRPAEPETDDPAPQAQASELPTPDFFA